MIYPYKGEEMMVCQINLLHILICHRSLVLVIYEGLG